MQRAPLPPATPQRTPAIPLAAAQTPLPSSPSSSPITTRRKRAANTPSPQTQRPAIRRKRATAIEVIEQNNGCVEEEEPSLDSSNFPTLSTLLAGPIDLTSSPTPPPRDPPSSTHIPATLDPYIQPTYDGYIQPTLDPHIQPTLDGHMQPTLETYMQPTLETYMQPTLGHIQATLETGEDAYAKRAASSRRNATTTASPPPHTPSPPIAAREESIEFYDPRIAALQDAHAEAIAPILEKSSIQALLAYAKIPVPEKRLHARQAILFAQAAERAAAAFLQTPREKQLLNFLLLPRILGLALRKGDLAATMRAFPQVIPTITDEDISTPSLSKEESRTERAIKLLEKGYIGRAAQALVETSTIALNTTKTLETLFEKHPIGPRNPFTAGNPQPGQSITLEAISAAIASINKEKAPGLSGWTRPLLEIATNTSFKSPVTSAIRLLADMIRQGTAPGVELLCASRLIPFAKENNGVRPIAVGDLVYRVALKAILTTSFRPEMLLPNQLGVNSKGGVEPAVFMLQEAITGPNTSKVQKIASLDLSNAFNTIGRTAIATAVAKYAPTFYRAAKWAYNKPSILVTLNGQILASAEGVRQGDPLGPLLFSLALRPTLEHLQDTLPTSNLVAYLDDIYVLSKDKDVNILEKAASSFQGTLVKLNLQKSSETDISVLQNQGFKTLGTFIGPLPLRKAFLLEKKRMLLTALTSLHDLPKQYALLLLRSSTHLLLRHLLRQLDPIGLETEWQSIDRQIAWTIQRLAAREVAFRGILDLHAEVIALPVRDGGFGIPSYARLAIPLYEAAKNAAFALITQIRPGQNTLCEGSIVQLTAKDVLTEENAVLLRSLSAKLLQSQKNALLENTSYFGRSWLRVLPTQKQYTLADSDATEAIRSRLLLPVRPLDSPCSFCGAKPQISHEDVCKGAERRWISRHNQVSRAFINTLSCREDLKVEREPIVAEIQPGDPNPLRADFSVQIGVSRFFYDVQIVAINKDSARKDAAATLTEAAEEKRRKYKVLGTSFKPLIFSAGGLMEKDTAQAYKGLQALIGPSNARWLDKTIALALTQARAQAAASIAKSIATPSRRLQDN